MFIVYKVIRGSQGLVCGCTPSYKWSLLIPLAVEDIAYLPVTCLKSSPRRQAKNIPSAYSPVVKRGWLENPGYWLLSSMNFPAIKLGFGDFPVACHVWWHQEVVFFLFVSSLGTIHFPWGLSLASEGFSVWTCLVFRDLGHELMRLGMIGLGDDPLGFVQSGAPRHQ